MTDSKDTIILKSGIKVLVTVYYVRQGHRNLTFAEGRTIIAFANK